MRNIYEVLRQKELDVSRLQKKLRRCVSPPRFCSRTGRQKITTSRHYRIRLRRSLSICKRKTKVRNRPKPLDGAEQSAG